jgi:glucokinase
MEVSILDSYEEIRAMTRHFDYLAAGIAGLINIFAPRKLIIGGGIYGHRGRTVGQ